LTAEANNNLDYDETPREPALDYHALNAKLNLVGDDGKLQLDADHEAARQFFLQHVNHNTVYFDDLEKKIDYLITNHYYEREFIEQYDWAFVKDLYKRAYSYKFRFPTFMGAFKYYSSYTLKTFDGKRYLERYEDRVVANALYLGRGDQELATSILDEIMTGRYQPATPTFLNAGKAQRGELVSCFLTRVEDNLESISRAITNALQLSKRGGGVALLLTNIRETGAPIKRIENQSSGIVPVMKLLEDSFSYANQLGARQGAGAVYLSAHHPDIMKFLDTKRENADEKIRIKTLSLGVVIPDITFKLAKNNDDMYLFSPYDVERVYGTPMSDISITEKYHEMVENPDIRKTKIKARRLFQVIAEISMESGYPYLLFEDTATKANPLNGRINMSNLCSEILQVNEASEYNPNGSYSHVGKDISCNLGSLNITKTFDSPDFAKTIETGIRALTSVSDLSNIDAVPSVENGNHSTHSIGLGMMNLHGFLAREHIHYDSPEAVEFAGLFAYAFNYWSIVASNKIAKETGQVFDGFDTSEYADGSYFNKYIEKNWGRITSPKISALLGRSSIYLPTQADWEKLKNDVMEHGLYNGYRLCIPPTGSISYLNYSTASIHPIISPIEIRKEGKLGRVYAPAPYLSDDTLPFYRDAYKIGPEAIIDIYAAMTPHIDQGLSLTLFWPDTATTRDMNKAYIYAWRKGIKTIYYARIRQLALEGTQVEGTAAGYCESCQL
jgi:ribonucleoside-diphosphate reductase alpha chain